MLYQIYSMDIKAHAWYKTANQNISIRKLDIKIDYYIMYSRYVVHTS